MIVIRRCQAGDQNAFAYLFDQYKNLVYRTAYLTLGNPSDAEDVLQEVFVQVHRSLAKYDPARGAFSTWLYRITVNKALNSWGGARPRRNTWKIPRGVSYAGGRDPQEQVGESAAVQQALGHT